MNRCTFGVVLACVAVASAAPASATIISFAYDGSITDGVDTSGLFGTAGADLTGDRVRVVFTFDTGLGERGTVTGTTDSLLGGTSVPGSPASPLVSALVTIDGHSTSIGGDLLASALTEGGVFNASEAIEDDADFVQAFVYTKDAPASLDTPFVPHGTGSGSFNIDRIDATSGLSQIASADFAIPEPSTWAMLLTGFGGIGAAMRNGRRPRGAQRA
jgi:hypothetical protein